jgi:hypothetical protein
MRDDTPAARGRTVRETAAFLRIGKAKVCTLIKVGELGAADVGTPGRPRWVVLPEHLERFLDARRVRPAPRPQRRKRRPAGTIDYYP